MLEGTAGAPIDDGARAERGWLSSYLPPASLQHYQDLGYVLLAAPIALTFWLARQASFAMTDLMQGLPAGAALLLRVLFAAVPLPEDYQLGLSLVQYLLALYLVFWPFRGVRRSLGGLYADFLSWLATRAVAAAAWCLDHRWASLGLMLLLTVMSGLSIRSYALDRTAERVVESGFDAWMHEAEDLLGTSTLDGNVEEMRRYRRLAARWDDRFERILGRQERKAALCLRDLVGGLHEGYDPAGSWIDHLVRRRAGLVKSHAIIAKVDLATARGRLARVTELSRILLARVHMRLSLDDCSDLTMALQSHAFLEGTGKTYPAMAANARGNVYNCLFDALLEERDRPGVLGGNHGPVHERCATHAECLGKALTEYAAAKGEEPCSFAWRRALNNDLDVKLRLALYADALDLSALAADARQPALGSRERLAAEIEGRAQELLACNPTEPLVFVTASQAYAAAAGLRQEGSDEQARDLRAAGVFLRLGSSHRPGDLGQWNLAFFCAALNEQGYREDFLLGLGAPAGLRVLDAELLRDRIRPRCRP